MTKNEITIRLAHQAELDSVAKLMAQAYYNDVFFKWCVPPDDIREQTIYNYYKVYLTSQHCFCCVAVDTDNRLFGAMVWLSNETEAWIYEKIEQVVGDYAANFAEVAEKSHANEPKNTPFWQLVGFGTSNEARGLGIGIKLMDFALKAFDTQGIPTYLEASTAYVEGKGVYGKFGYRFFSDLMCFDEGRVKLYPLWRGVGG